MSKRTTAEQREAFIVRHVGSETFATVAELAGVSQSELARAAYVRSIEPCYDEAMVAEELA
jgi:hypothetical protein